MSELAGHFGGIDILVNNAGGQTENRELGDDDPERWEEVLQVHVLGSYFCARSALPFLRRTGGHIIMVGSGMGHQPAAGSSAYNVAKAGVWMLTRCLALELRESSIAVNEVVPGFVRTQSTASLVDENGRPLNPALANEWVKDPEDVAPLVVFLAAQPSSGATGQLFSLARRPL
jgi:3-oxoacyl-[acyl-carrier protein] reductase